MRGLTLTAPYGTLIALAEKWPDLGKQHETRGRPFHYRGWLAIHQGKNLTPVEGVNGLADMCNREPFRSSIEAWYGDAATAHEWMHILPLGKIVAVADYTACYIVGRGGRRMYRFTDRRLDGSDAPLPTGNDLAFGNYTPGRYAFKLEQIRALPEPIPFRGSQGLWNVPEDVQASIWGQLR